MMEYGFYLEQKFYDSGRLETRVLTAQEAEALGYQNGHKAHGEGYTVYVDGYVSEKAVQDFLDEIAAMNTAYTLQNKTRRAEKGDAR